jgi:8-oxo-dGTP pyrophosphatase MutT (NUDIX family)
VPLNRVVRQAGCIIFKNGQVVLRRAADGTLVFPKGHLELGEDEAQAAVREAAEETGLAVRLVRPLGTITFTLGDEERQVTYFLAEAVQELTSWPSHLNHDALLLLPPQVRTALSHENTRAIWDALDAAQKESNR